MFLECAVLQKRRDEYYTVNSLNSLFDKIPGSYIVEFLREAGFFYLIWTVRHLIQSLTWTIPKLMHFLNSWTLHRWLLHDNLWDHPRGLHDKSFWKKTDSFIWYIQYNSLFKSVTNWQNSQLELIPTATAPDFVYRIWAAMRDPYLWRTANMSWRMCVVVKQMLYRLSMGYHTVSPAPVWVRIPGSVTILGQVTQFWQNILDLYYSTGSGKLFS